ncbi:MAG TPA: MauE/DoxX family redox-associated membrane protein [Candidatus Methanoperedens sp.]|nr:MauE/DoxX family redox-associated membrane protein [Candidatus Methanoperedens sp.]
MSGIGGLATMVQRQVLPRGPSARPLVTVLFVVRLVLAVLFIWAGVLKLSHPRAFAHVIDGYGLVSDGWPLVLAAFTIPILELLAGVGVLLDREAGHWLMLGLLGVFIGVLWFGILNDLDVDCGCFSLEEQRGQAGLKTAFVRDWLMAGGAVWCLLLRRRGTKRGRKTVATNSREGQA